MNKEEYQTQIIAQILGLILFVFVLVGIKIFLYLKTDTLGIIVINIIPITCSVGLMLKKKWGCVLTTILIITAYIFFTYSLIVDIKFPIMAIFMTICVALIIYAFCKSYKYLN